MKERQQYCLNDILEAEELPCVFCGQKFKKKKNEATITCQDCAKKYNFTHLQESHYQPTV